MPHFMLIPSLSPDELARFWAKVDRCGGPDACWLWRGGCHHFGYGRCYIGRKSFLTHRVSWEIHHGPIPKDMLVCHNCPDGDNPACVNPAHLFLGTNDDNMRDMTDKRRSPIGVRNASAKLSDDLVREIRMSAQSGESLHDIARRMPVGVSVICEIVHFRAWAHVRDGELVVGRPNDGE